MNSEPGQSQTMKGCPDEAKVSTETGAPTAAKALRDWILRKARTEFSRG